MPFFLILGSFWEVNLGIFAFSYFPFLLLKCVEFIDVDSKLIKYSEIEQLILPHSLLMSSQLISYLIKPNIATGNIIKQNHVKVKSNYKDDVYLIN